MALMISKSRSRPPRTRRPGRARRRLASARLASAMLAARGYTVVEVMMALSVLAVGGMGVVGLQKFAVVGALDARGITGASTVATGWIDFCQNEAAVWNLPDNSDKTEMPLVSQALVTPGVWIQIPTINVNNYLPNAGSTMIDGSTDAMYCSQIRATWIGPPDALTAQNNATASDVIRIDVRTWYAKSGRPVTAECATWDGSTVDDLLATPGATASDGTIMRSRYEYGWVFESGTIRRNTL
jgi:prepilin-type N-terminal cleavage/methylation domain-containing protein